MLPKELSDYIASEREKGVDDATIRQNLMQGGGWTSADLDQAMKPPGSDLPRDWNAPRQTQTSNYTPYQPQTQYMANTNAPDPLKSGGSVTRNVLIILCLLVILGLGGGAYAYWNGMFGLGGTPPYAEGQLFTGILNKAKDFTAFKYATKFRIAAGPRDSGATPIPYNASNYSDSTFFYLAERLQSVSADTFFDGSLSGTYSKPTLGQTTNAEFGFKLTGKFDDFTLDMDAELKKISPDYYVILRKFPTFFIFSTITPLKNQWIRLSPKKSTSTDYYSYGSRGMIENLEYSISSTDKSINESQDEYKENLRKVLSAADSTNLLVMTEKPLFTELNDERLWRYELALNKHNLVAFAEEMVRTFPSDTSAVVYYREYKTQAERFLEYLQDPDNQPMIDYVINNSFITLWVDKAGMPRELAFRFRVVPPPEAVQLAGKQVDYVTTVSLSDINKQIVIQAPAEYLTAKQADELLEKLNPSMLVARERGKDARIISDIQQLRTAIESDYDGVSYRRSFISPTKLSNAPTYKALTDDITTQGGSFNVVSTSAYNSYALYGRLVSDPKKYFCIDSSGKTNSGTTINTGKTCPTGR